MKRPSLYQNQFQDLSQFPRRQISRGRPAWFVQFWWVFDAILVRPLPQAFYAWRRVAWRLFGAKIGRKVLIRPGARATFPWKVEIGDYCWIGDNVTLYSIAKITIGDHSVISQDAYLCTATHDHRDLTFPLIAKSIALEGECWVAARAFIGPGVTMGRGSVAGAGSLVLSDVQPGSVVAGNPARQISVRDVGSN